MDQILDGVEFDDTDSGNKIFNELKNYSTIKERLELARDKVCCEVPDKLIYERYLDNVTYILDDVNLTSKVYAGYTNIFEELELLPNAESRINFCKTQINKFNNDMNNKHIELDNILRELENPEIVEGITIDIDMLYNCESNCREDIKYIEDNINFYNYYLEHAKM
jgi:hypothetical protein